MQTTPPSYYYSESNFLTVARGLVPAPVLQELRTQYLNSISELQSQGGLSQKELVEDRLGTAPDQLRLKESWYSLWKEANLDWFDRVEKFDKVIYPPMLRTVYNQAGFVPWHQDAGYMKDMGPRGHSRVITCFFPLNDEPSLHPSLQFYPNKTQEEELHVKRAGFKRNQVTLPPEFEPADSQCLTVPLKLGDAFLFGQHIVHRTHFKDAAFEPRHSIEFRLTSEDSMISGKDYYDLKSGKFIKG